ncbi:MAG: OmpA family protein, partial [Anaerolineae bacterium]
MANGRPMLGDVELQLVQKIETDEDEVLTQHGVPALEGDFLQRQRRRATQVTLTGVLTGPEAGEGLKTLRDKFRAAEPVPFVADIATAVRVDEMLIEEMGVRELAGKPERFEYAFTLREYIPAEEVITEEPPIRPPPPVTSTLVVEVIVEGQPDFDYNRVTVTVAGSRQEDGSSLSRTLTNRTGNEWTEAEFPPGTYTATATVNDPPPMPNSEPVVVRADQPETRVTIILRVDENKAIAKAYIVHFWFDKAFIEPCLRSVLRQVAEHAQDHPDEKLIIVGHTDLTGGDDYNQSLSERRARSVFAYLTFGRDPAAALSEWDQLRRRRPAGESPSIKDTWAVREYQYMLQDLGFYAGNIDENHGPQTDQAVENFRAAKGLPPGVTVDDAVWAALIQDYMAQDNLAVPESQFLPNCDNEILKWLGCGEKDPVRNTQDAWRPNRRTELLFVKAESLPCEVPQPFTFELPQPGAVGSAWCLGPGDPNARCCFLTRQAEEEGKFFVQPAEPGAVVVQGSIKFEDGTPLANNKYVPIAPDGEFMDGERPSGENRGRPIPGRTAADGTFAYPDKPKGIGIYTLE